MMWVAPRRDILKPAFAVGSLVVLIVSVGELARDRTQLMKTASPPSRDEKTIDAKVTIQRPVAEVFRFYWDFKNLPGFVGDVMAIEQIDPTTSQWTIQGPLGIRVNWTIKVTEECANELIRYERLPPLH